MLQRKTVLSLFAGAALTIGAVSTLTANASETVVMNIGWATPLDSDYGILSKKFEELAESYTNGGVDVKLRCCAQIATEDDAFKALQLGTVDAYFISQNNISPHWPLMDVFVLPYIFQSGEHLVKVASGPVGDKIRAKLQADTGVYLLTFGGPGYRDMFNSKRPINSIEDLKGLKMRVPKNEVMLATFEAFGAEPVPLAWSETPTALQTGTIDGGDNGTSVIREMKFFEFAKNLVILDHFAGFAPVLASDRFMSRLSDDKRAAVLKAAAEAGAYHTKIKLAEIEGIRNWLSTEGGMKVTRPDRTEFIKAAQTVQQDFAKKRGQEFTDLVNAIQAAAD